MAEVGPKSTVGQYIPGPDGGLVELHEGVWWQWQWQASIGRNIWVQVGTASAMPDGPQASASMARDPTAAPPNAVPPQPQQLPPLVLRPPLAVKAPPPGLAFIVRPKAPAVEPNGHGNLQSPEALAAMAHAQVQAISAGAAQVQAQQQPQHQASGHEQQQQQQQQQASDSGAAPSVHQWDPMHTGRQQQQQQQPAAVPMVDLLDLWNDNVPMPTAAQTTQDQTNK